ncbi:MAG: CPBP family intramembrane metalloprotease [bacterium]|nr:CPBP family intramembrane metalloprotease [bacterium]
MKRTEITNYLKDFFNFEGIVLISSTVILSVIIAFEVDLSLLWPSKLSISLLPIEIPGFRIFGWMINQTLLYMIIPLILILLYKKKPRDFGLQIKEIRGMWKYLLLFSIGIIIITFFVSKNPRFQEVYPMYKYARNDLSLLIIYEIIFLIYLFSWEFLFRGFILFGLEKRFGNYAILIQMIPFAIMHFAKPPVELLSSILGGILLGVIALRTRSVVPCWILHLMFSVPMDIFVYIWT